MHCFLEHKADTVHKERLFSEMGHFRYPFLSRNNYKQLDDRKLSWAMVKQENNVDTLSLFLQFN